MQPQYRVTAITGGSRGIGASIAERVAEEGSAVLIGYRNDERAANAVAERVRRAGQRALTAAVDVTSPGSVAAFFAAGIWLSFRLRPPSSQRARIWDHSPA